MRVERYGLVVAVSVLALACGKKPEPEAPVPSATTQPGPSMATNRDDDADARAAAEAARAREAAAARRAMLEETVYFDYDRSDLDAAQQETLRRKVEVLRSESQIRLRIEGHADERGSLEYNLALGMRRAQSVLGYLAGFGLDASRFTVESLGEDRPAAAGHSEAAWSRNRRAEFVVTGGVSAAR